MSTLEVKGIQAPAGYKLSMPAGHIIQVVSTTESVGYSTTTSDFSARATGLSATITPRSTSSKILVTIGAIVGFQYNNTYGKTAIYRSISGGASNNLTGETGGFGNVGNGAYQFGKVISYLDSPSSTSAITYSLTFAYSAGGVGIVYIGANDGSSTITLMEVAG
jgi:hypothetical protein